MTQYIIRADTNSNSLPAKKPIQKRSPIKRVLAAAAVLCFSVSLSSCEQAVEEAVQCDLDGAHLVLQSSPQDAIALDYQADFVDGAVVAPAAIVSVDGVEQQLALKVSADFGAWDEISAQVESNPSPIKSLAFSVKGEDTYGPVVEVLSDGPVEVAATCSATVTHADATASAGEMACSVMLAFAMEEPVAGCGTFDCHSHWGIGVTTCHCNTANCCPGEVCECGPNGAQTCHRTTFCSCD